MRPHELFELSTIRLVACILDSILRRGSYPLLGGVVRWTARAACQSRTGLEPSGTGHQL